MADMSTLLSPQLAVLTARRNSPICALGTTIIFLYFIGISIYLWSANFACRLRDFGDSAAIQLSGASWNVEQRGKYLVIANYVRAALKPDISHTMTFAAAAIFPELTHVQEICIRWQGPMSIAVYAPGSDFKSALKKIFQHRLSSSCIHQNATWHVFYDAEYGPSPEEVVAPEVVAEFSSSSHNYESWIKGTFKSHSNLPFPANIGRNVAIQHALTKYSLVCDLHYYPSSNIIPRFLKLMDFEGPAGNKVYVLPVFKMAGYRNPPETKSELVKMTSEGDIILHTGTSDCTQCNIFPNARKWLEARSPDDTLSVYYVSQEKDEFESWQPFYIFKKSIPLFGEEQVKEGRFDRKLQLLELCLQHYQFHILDNAFLVEVLQEEEKLKDINVLQGFVKHNNKAREKRIEALLCRYGSDTGCSI